MIATSHQTVVALPVKLSTMPLRSKNLPPRGPIIPLSVLDAMPTIPLVLISFNQLSKNDYGRTTQQCFRTPQTNRGDQGLTSTSDRATGEVFGKSNVMTSQADAKKRYRL